jgi:hypothetical protein
MADKQESKVTCCGIEFCDSDAWVQHLLSKADHDNPMFPEGQWQLAQGQKLLSSTATEKTEAENG